MLAVPQSLQAQFEDLLRKRAVPKGEHGRFKMWLRNYLDFCEKYQFRAEGKDSLPAFLGKLRERGQTQAQQEQAVFAVRAFYEIAEQEPASRGPAGGHAVGPSRNGYHRAMEPCHILEDSSYPWGDRGASPHSPQSREVVVRHERADSGRDRRRPDPVSGAMPPQPARRPGDGPEKKDQQAGAASAVELRHTGSGKGASWAAEYAALANEIKVRHYSIKTLSTYRGWARKFQAYTKSRPPSSLSTLDVKEFLTFLAVRRKVSSSTQNQAFNALLFFFRHALGREFGAVDGVVRAKRRPYIPVVLSREEIDAICANLSPPYDLAVKLLYGCGLRLSECLNLRVHCFNFDAGILTVHDGKGQKDRTVPLPRTIVPELQRQLELVKDLHQRDLARNYDGVFLMNSLDRKYKNAARELIWQWFFPAKQMTYVEAANEHRRYHLHETHVQKAIQLAVRKAGIPKRASAHTFRHSFASHLLLANYDIRTIQQLLGHSDVRTTMIYTHTVPSRTLKEARSPLDF